MIRIQLLGITCGVYLAACSIGNGTGTLQVFVEAEDTIPLGLQAEGAAHDEDEGGHTHGIADGWSVTYETFVVAFGNFRAQKSSDVNARLSDSSVYVIDLRNLASSGLIVSEFEDVEAGRYDQVGFDLPNASADTLCAEGTHAADCERLKMEQGSLWIAGTVDNGQKSVTFDWLFHAGTSFDDCAPEEGDSGFAIAEGGTTQVKPTIHGDHWFFTNITAGAEITELCASYIVLADEQGNQDNAVSIEELQALPAAVAFPAGGDTACEQYNLSGTVEGAPVQTAFDYVVAQARTLGDFQGEGECPSRAILP